MNNKIRQIINEWDIEEEVCGRDSITDRAEKGKVKRAYISLFTRCQKYGCP